MFQEDNVRVINRGANCRPAARTDLVRLRTKFIQKLASTSGLVAVPLLALLILSVTMARAGTEQDIRDATLERKTLTSQRLGELDLNHDGKVDVADAAMNSVAEGVLPKAGLWVVILTPDDTAAGGSTQFFMLLSYDASGSRIGSVTNQGSGFLSQGGTVFLPPDRNSPISFRAEVTDNTVLPETSSAIALPFAHSLVLSNEPSINPFLGTNMMTGRYAEILAPTPAAPQTGHLATRVYGSFLMGRVPDAANVPEPILINAP